MPAMVIHQTFLWSWVWWGLWGIRLWNSKHCFVPWEWSDSPRLAHLEGKFLLLLFPGLSWGLKRTAIFMNHVFVPSGSEYSSLGCRVRTKKRNTAVEAPFIRHSFFLYNSSPQKKGQLLFAVTFVETRVSALTIVKNEQNPWATSLNCLQINRGMVLDSWDLVWIYNHVSRLRDK